MIVYRSSAQQNPCSWGLAIKNTIKERVELDLVARPKGLTESGLMLKISEVVSKYCAVNVCIYDIV